MIWQDWVFGIGTIIFSIALVPSVLGKEKPAISTSLSTGITLMFFAFAQATLALWFACGASVLASVLWLTLAVQKRREKGEEAVLNPTDKIKLGTYKHYKGNKYRVLGVAKHSESLEDMVVYEALYREGGLYVRPLKMFLEEVELSGKRTPRFEFLGEKV